MSENVLRVRPETLTVFEAVVYFVAEDKAHSKSEAKRCVCGLVFVSSVCFWVCVSVSTQNEVISQPFGCSLWSFTLLTALMTIDYQLVLLWDSFGFISQSSHENLTNLNCDFTLLVLGRKTHKPFLWFQIVFHIETSANIWFSVSSSFQLSFCLLPMWLTKVSRTPLIQVLHTSSSFPG